MAPVLVVLLVLLIVVPITEISLIVLVGQQIGAIPTVLLLIGSALLGSWLLRREGRRAWRELKTAADAGRPPALEAVSGVLVLVGGLMMMLPGFATDTLGVLLIIPPIRRAVAQLVIARFARRLSPQVATGLFGPARIRAQRGEATQSGASAPGGPGAQAVPPSSGPLPPGRVIEGEVDR
jgi:UPF0716 protein FxsA